MDKQQYGIERLCTLISQHWQKSTAKIQQVVVKDLCLHIGEQKLNDDIILLVLKKT
ncbi:hypothetical protein [Candidatus Venteria ishoeyi]|uniref:hypothetical protein n=1 Tax=Candidatus Venteria ishoeyi TaxID=1899563 RepID=UPI0015AB5299|nr:hypothetical protein [Candidatus Venteria ishoeyi]